MSITPNTNAEPIHRWVICFAGFCQDEGENIGVARLWRKLVKRCNGPNSVVLMREWHQPVNDLAGLIAQFNGGPDILICGYSYGGQTAVNLARALQRRKIGVRQFVLMRAGCPGVMPCPPQGPSDRFATLAKVFRRRFLGRS